MKCKLDTCNNDTSKPGRLYCCIECSKIGQLVSRSLIMDTIKDKRRNTNLERYGVENAGQSADLRQKYKKTNLERYGFENPLSNADVRHKAKITNIEKYGYENSASSIVVKDKIKKTNINRYGVNFASQLETVMAATRKTNLERYSVEYHTQSHITQAALSVYRDHYWLTNEYHNELKPIYVIAAELGISKSQLGKIFSTNNIEVLNLRKSREELELLLYVQSLTSANIQANVRNIIGGKELDIFIPQHNVAIEYNGSFWHSEKYGNKDKQYHLSKTLKCQQAGINLLHVFDYEWKYKTEIIKSIINSNLGLLSVIYARKCKIREIDNKTEKDFLEINHIQGHVSSKYCVGLYYNDELVSLMSFGKTRYSKHEYELLRFANKLNFSVLGGASKLFCKFVKEINPQSIISYSHRDKFTGNLYKKLGFEYSHSSNPSYKYTKDYINFENRMKYQKHKLKKILPVFDVNFTEWQNMQNNGYDRIWDCGNDVWVWNNKGIV